MHKALYIVCALAASGVCGAATPPPDLCGCGYYASFALGAGLAEDRDERNLGQAHYASKLGAITGLALGKRYTGLRAEAELSYQNYPMDRTRFDGLGSFGASGRTSYLSVMANVVGDWRSVPGTINPYTGFGLGVSRVGWDNVRCDTCSLSIDDSDTVFAYQAMIGFDYAVRRAWSLGLEYRYFHAGGVTLRDSGGNEERFGGSRNNLFWLRLHRNF